MVPRVSQLLEAVSEVAQLIGATALEYYRRPLRVEAKADGSPVTLADRTAEAKARKWITHRFPDDGLLGEEFGELRPEAARQWIIDPIDGTKSFIRGVPLWGSLVAVCEGPIVLAGAAFYPALGETLSAARGEGCWWNGALCHVSTVSNVSAATLLTTDERFAGQDERARSWHELGNRAAIARSWGDCFGYLLVAPGRADVMVDPVLSTWDAAPFLPIISEAGGVFTDWAGQVTIHGGSAIATNQALAIDIRTALGCRVDQSAQENR